ncbi:MAG: phospho-N-acetylmuramoyl-pentapeptide-transferase [Planctomycetes bacterium]|nr:phospho-N-acetylmuramoyl-pentapeptide-transferase [Planctomycetota bacterium]
MIYHLCQYLDPDKQSLLRLGHAYISFRAGLAFLFAMAIVLFLLPRSYHIFVRYGWVNRQRSYMIDSSSKEGVPVMGGMHIFIGGMLAFLLFCDLTNRYVHIALFASVFSFFLGLMDDLLKIRDGNHDGGISRKGKYLVQAFVGLTVGVLLYSQWSPHPELLRGTICLPAIKEPLDVGLLQIPFVMLVVMFISNAVNFADGMDGLATGPSFLTFMGLGIFSYILGHAIWSEHFLYFYFSDMEGTVFLNSSELVIICAASMGALMGFLWYNTYPATIFMGDCGSMYLGGLLASIFVMLKQEWVFPILGFLFVLELASVLIQDWLGIGLLGRRIFFRAPYHENLKYKGYSEPKIVVRMWILSAAMLALALLTLKIR